MSTKIKKSFAPIIEMLNAAAEAGKSVQDILADAVSLASAKGRASAGPRELSYLKDDAGTVVAIRDYYFKRWMPLVGDEAVEFGKKSNTATGYNTMCKEGLSAWNAQQAVAKKATAQILADVESGDLEPTDIADRRGEIEEKRNAIIDTELGFSTRDEVVEYLESEGVTLATDEAE